jgi:hypothetical protein
MPIVIDELTVEVPPPEAAAGQQARAAQGPAGMPAAPPWTPELARLLDRQLELALERQARLAAD